MMIKFIIFKVLFLLVIGGQVQADEVGKTNSIPQTWISHPNLSICEIREGKLVMKTIIKGLKIIDNHDFAKNKAERTSYLIIHSKNKIIYFYPVVNNQIILRLNDLNQVFTIKYDVDKTKSLFKKKIKESHEEQ